MHMDMILRASLVAAECCNCCDESERYIQESATDKDLLPQTV